MSAGLLEEQETNDGVAGRADAGNDDATVPNVFAHHAKCVPQRRRDDDGGAVLVVVENRDVQDLPQPRLDLEAARGRDVLEVDAAVHGRQQLHGADDLLGIGGVQAHRPGVHTGKLLEQRRLALHHRQRRRRADVAQAQHGSSIGDHRDRVPLDGQATRVLRILGDGQADPGDPGCVGP